MHGTELHYPDTNVVLRYLLKDVPEQFAVAESFFEQVRIGGKKAFLLESVVVECLHVLTKFYHVPRADAAAPLAEMLRYKGISNIDTGVLLDALDLYARTSLDPVDCVLAARTRKGSGRLFTFDKALLKASAKPRKSGS